MVNWEGTKMDVTTLVGKRMLVKGANRTYNSSVVEEVRLLEVSPSGNWVRFMSCAGNKYWRPMSEVALVEVLQSLDKGKPGE